MRRRIVVLFDPFAGSVRAQIAIVVQAGDASRPNKTPFHTLHIPEDSRRLQRLLRALPQLLLRGKQDRPLGRILSSPEGTRTA